MRATTSLPPLLLLSLLAVAPAGATEGPRVTSDTFGALAARALGPAVMSGRITALDAVPGDPLTLFVGSASGGVWRSTDGGVTFAPVFDEHPQSIGALRVDPSDPKTVWVGTGESCVRNSVSIGDGVYRSTDGGDSWTHLGLAGTERIAALAIDPKQRDTVYVCALGPLWNASEERGVYRTRDGGKSWEKVLHLDADTGCSDLAIDPQEPRILYAGMWTHRRSPDFFRSGGKGSGLYRSADGGTTWERVSTGLPAGELGRIAVAVAPSRPSVVYAVVEAKKTALYRSDDTGRTWSEGSSGFNVQARPFYFAHLFVDPRDHDTVYKPGLTLSVSTDGGRSMSGGIGFGASYHSDVHALWIDPRDPKTIWMGTDGGLYVSRDRAFHWAFLPGLPISQFYHVSFDMAVPYNVYGGLQDNSSWTGPSQSAGGVENRDWENIGTGDGFWAYADPTDSDFAYSMYQGGEVLRVHRPTGEVKEIKPFAASGEEELRFNWNAPLVLSPNDPGTLYLGAQVLFRSRDRGDSWQRISPDLTTDDPARQRQRESGGLTIDNSTAENNTTIYTVAESPRDRDVLWVGTDDGNVQVSRDGGGSWTNVAAGIPGWRAGTWVSRIEASPHDAATAFVTLDDHRRGDMRPHLARTADFGATWVSLVTPEIEGYCWVVRQDPVNPDLLFLGTELGLYVSIDGGGAWARFKGNLPRVAVHDLAIHPREHDLVIATHGRGIYILDDLTPLRALTAETLARDAALLPSRPGRQTVLASVGSWFSGDAEFVGRNLPEAAPIVYWLKKRHLFGDLKVEVLDTEGRVISTIPGSKRVGLNRVEWPMRMDPPKFPPSTQLTFAFTGPRLPEGEYAIRLVRGKEVLESTVALVADPRNPHSTADRKAKSEAELALYHRLADLTHLVESALALRDGARTRAAALPAGDRLGRRLRGLAEQAESLRTALVATSEAGWISGEERLKEKLGNLYGAINRFEGRPTTSQLARMETLLAELTGAEQRFRGLAEGDLAAANAELVRRRLEPLALPTREEREPGGTGPVAAGSLSPRDAKRLAARFPALAAPLFGLRTSL
ncbi:MAG: glycoside hydrolase [Thermoanaerobaculia bacterium]|nr:glycoside hydrolase [Thermoanaerobaculia bacterium]